jgi:hypothetical protein
VVELPQATYQDFKMKHKRYLLLCLSFLPQVGMEIEM